MLLFLCIVSTYYDFLANQVKFHGLNFSDLNWGQLGVSLDVYPGRCQGTTQVLAPQARETWFTVLGWGILRVP